MSTELSERHNPDCALCRGTGWCNDENWQPAHLDVPTERVPHNGMIECGCWFYYEPITWPKERTVRRMGDMSPVATLIVSLDADSDACLSVLDEDGMADIEFCIGGTGGGKSPRTREALIALMVAMEADNAEFPCRMVPAERSRDPA